MSFMRSSTGGRRALISACLATALLLLATGASLAAPLGPTATGTLLGSVTCGPSEDAPAAQAIIAIEGSDIAATRTDGTGRFILTNVPTGQLLTIDALADPQGSVASRRYDVSVQPGQTLDIGNLDLAVCPAPAPASAVADTTSQDQPQPDSFPQP